MDVEGRLCADLDCGHHRDAAHLLPPGAYAEGHIGRLVECLRCA